MAATQSEHPKIVEENLLDIPQISSELQKCGGECLVNVRGQNKINNNKITAGYSQGLQVASGQLPVVSMHKHSVPTVGSQYY